MSSGRDAGDGPRVDCSCGQIFRVPRSLAGGLANCPSCGQVNDVPAVGAEWLFVLSVGAGALVVLAAAAIATAAAGWKAGLAALVIGGALLGGAIAAS